MEECPNGGKVIYASEHKAKMARNTIHKSSGKEMKVYKCPNCYGWHLTHHRETWK